MKIVSILLFFCFSTFVYAATSTHSSNPEAGGDTAIPDTVNTNPSSSNSNVLHVNPETEHKIHPNPTTNTQTNSGTGTGTVQGNGIGTGSGQDTGIGSSGAAENDTRNEFRR